MVYVYDFVIAYQWLNLLNRRVNQEVRREKMPVFSVRTVLTIPLVVASVRHVTPTPFLLKVIAISQYIL